MTLFAPHAVAPRRLGQALLLMLGLASCGGGGGAGAGGGNPAGGPPDPTNPPVEAPTAFTDLTAETGFAPGQVILRFTAPANPAGGARATAYEVRAQVQHITVANVLAAPLVPQSVVPGSPGTGEVLTLADLEGGRALQFVLRARFGATWGPFSYSVATRVKDGGPPAPPPNVVQLAAGATLDHSGTTYLLTRDIATAGTAFRVTAKDVTLDLGGHTVTYGTAAGVSYGLYTEYLFDTGLLTVRNGAFVQGGALGAKCHAIAIRGAHDVRLTRLSIGVDGADCDGILVYEGLTGSIRVDHNTIACRTKVVSDRHFPGVGAIWMGALEGPVEVDHNLVTATPQWGIKVQGRATTGVFRVHHNRVVGTKALYANGYSFGIHKPKADVFENEVHGESRGIHLDGVDNFGNEAEVHDNAIWSQDQPNAEYPVHWTHGLKLEGTTGTRAHHNRVVAVADPTHSESIALDVALTGNGDVEVTDNLFVATSSVPGVLAHALNWSAGTLTAPNIVRIQRNVFRTTDRAITRGWPARAGGSIVRNAFVHDASAGHPWMFEFFDVSDIWPSPGHRVVDAWSESPLLTVSQWAQPALYDTTREATLRVVVTGASGVPRAGAAVSVRDVSGTQVAATTTDALGRADLLLVTERISNGPAIVARGPFTVNVNAAAAGSWSGPVTLAGRAALAVDLVANTGTLDQVAPPPPGAPVARALSATRGLAWWAAPADTSGIVFYEVWLDGALVALSDTPTVLLGGLDPARGYSLSVRAVDAGGNRSAASAAATLTLPVDDRGP